MDVGRVCVKLVGREAGKKCVVVDVVDESYVLVSGPEVKRRRCNVRHLEPLEQKLEIGEGASDEEVRRALGVEVEAKPRRPRKPKKPPEKKPPETKEPREEAEPPEEPEKPPEEKAAEEPQVEPEAEG
jgi:large subunit ribosomal protein L14e